MSTTPTTTADAPVLSRLYAWMNERFPPVVYSLLVAVFGVAGLGIGAATGGTQRGLAALAIVWLFMLHLRIVDEHKDFAADIVDHPQRVLSRGVVTLPLLAWVAVASLLLQLGLALSLGGPATVAWLLSVVFSGLMYAEFGVSRWLSRHMVVYALTHNPVMIGLALLVVLATRAPLAPVHVAFAALSCAAMLGFEFARKMNLPHEEHATVSSYTSALGQGRARAMLAATHALTGLCLGAVLTGLGVSTAFAVGVAALVSAPGLATCAGQQSAKRVELGASVVLLLSFGTVAAVAWSHS